MDPLLLIDVLVTLVMVAVGFHLGWVEMGEYLKARAKREEEWE